jgi:hypothetical protein
MVALSAGSYLAWEISQGARASASPLHLPLSFNYQVDYYPGHLV